MAGGYVLDLSVISQIRRDAGQEGARDGAVSLSFSNKQTPAGSRSPAFARAWPSSALPAQTPNPLSWAASSLAGTQAEDSQWREEDGGSGVWERPQRSPGQRWNGPGLVLPAPARSSPKLLLLYEL